MSGRAGRRGKDERGICIIMIDEQVVFDLSLPIIVVYDICTKQLSLYAVFKED